MKSKVRKYQSHDDNSLYLIYEVGSPFDGDLIDKIGSSFCIDGNSKQREGDIFRSIYICLWRNHSPLTLEHVNLSNKLLRDIEISKLFLYMLVI